MTFKHSEPHGRLRIQFIAPAYTPLPTGGLRVVFEYANFLAGRGHSVTIVFPRSLSPPASTAVTGVKNRLWPIKQRLLNRPLIPWHKLHASVRLTLVPELRDKYLPDGDAVVATMWSTASPVANLSPSKGRKFYLIQGHEIWAGPAEQVNATWLLPFRKIVISRWLENLGRELGATDVRYIPNGLDFQVFYITNPPQQRPTRVLSLYSDAALKGVSDAVAVLENYHERFPQIPVSMFGTAQRGDDLPAWITYLRNPTQATLAADFYNRGTIYLGASLSEGWGLPPAEAMACGCGFVGTDIGGFRDFATHNETALLSQPRDRNAMLRNLVAVTEDSGLLCRLQKHGTERIREFTWEKAGTALERYFLE